MNSDIKRALDKKWPRLRKKDPNKLNTVKEPKEVRDKKAEIKLESAHRISIHTDIINMLDSGKTPEEIKKYLLEHYSNSPLKDNFDKYISDRAKNIGRRRVFTKERREER